MTYKTYPPSSSLTPFVKCFWTLSSPATATPEIQRIVPDGCMEMIFHSGDLYEQIFEDGKILVQPRSFVFGQITSPLEIRPTGKTKILAARFHPDGFVPFISGSLQEMENKAVPLDQLFGEEGNLLEKEIMQHSSVSEKIKQLEHFLLNKLKGREWIERMIKSSVDIILKLKGQVSVEVLADQLNIHRRQLERKFSATIGMSPKQLAKIIRLQSSLKLLEKNQFTNLTNLAYDSGYFDQAHFIKDFREFTGMSPKQFYAGNLKMSSLFISGD